MMTTHPNGGGTRRRAAVVAANLIACAALGVGLVLGQASPTPTVTAMTSVSAGGSTLLARSGDGPMSSREPRQLCWP